ncbi:MAG: hypothetical protein GY869_27885, partial [Planctomycetes bacterium]|nr:hypothetical protein [Planctomycetota bacterium]
KTYNYITATGDYDVNGGSVILEYAGIFEGARDGVVQAWLHDTYNPDAFILVNEVTTHTTKPSPASAVVTLLPEFSMDSTQFGHEVAIKGDLAVVGAPWELSGEGVVYVYRLMNGVWTEEEILLMPDLEANAQHFGSVIEIDEDMIVVGVTEQNDPGHRTGAAYYFLYDEDAGLWDTGKKLSFSDKTIESAFGTGVALDRKKNRLVVGGSGRTSEGGFWTGKAWFYDWDESSKTWVEIHNVIQSDPQPDDYFGGNLSISGERVIIGAYSGVSHPTGEGKAYIFEWNEQEGRWMETKKLTASNASQNNKAHFGISTDIDGDIAVVGS